MKNETEIAVSLNPWEGQEEGEEEGEGERPLSSLFFFQIKIKGDYQIRCKRNLNFRTGFILSLELVLCFMLTNRSCWNFSMTNGEICHNDIARHHRIILIT